MRRWTNGNKLKAWASTVDGTTEIWNLVVPPPLPRLEFRIAYSQDWRNSLARSTEIVKHRNDFHSCATSSLFLHLSQGLARGRTDNYLLLVFENWKRENPCRALATHTHSCRIARTTTSIRGYADPRDCPLIRP